MQVRHASDILFHAQADIEQLSGLLVTYANDLRRGRRRAVAD